MPPAPALRHRSQTPLRRRPRWRAAHRCVAAASLAGCAASPAAGLGGAGRPAGRADRAGLRPRGEAAGRPARPGHAGGDAGAGGGAGSRLVAAPPAASPAASPPAGELSPGSLEQIPIRWTHLIG
ncbi:hypothetical protein DOO78_03420 [Roseicella frigidaeris]|uniref:Uncharacterized protein n=1 Tax=Roseicella frigidaeris TaxID=2230885 RepID=A0A327MB53_9PROT|nr:hypothetical protein DOO78_03420 [Roseicella frigidaeris]